MTEQRRYPWENDVEFCNFMATLEAKNPGGPAANVIRRALWWKFKNEGPLWDIPGDPLHQDDREGTKDVGQQHK